MELVAGGCTFYGSLETKSGNVADLVHCFSHQRQRKLSHHELGVRRGLWKKNMHSRRSPTRRDINIRGIPGETRPMRDGNIAASSSMDSNSRWLLNLPEPYKDFIYYFWTPLSTPENNGVRKPEVSIEEIKRGRYSLREKYWGVHSTGHTDI